LTWEEDEPAAAVAGEDTAPPVRSPLPLLRKNPKRQP
jgi:hypothetical protein